MTLLLVSDLHVPVKMMSIPDNLLEIAKQVDAVFGLGDFVDMETVLTLESVSNKFYAVCGNMDYPDVKDHLPSVKLLQLEEWKIGLFHGWGAPFKIRERILSTMTQKPQVIFYGHTHIPDDTVCESVRFVNPGSVAEDGSYALVELCKDHLKVEFKKLQAD
ncbi:MULTISPECIES: metallophosphoesterase family protein [Pseudothermotoga]|jgi:hypothetical protein|uniref:Phosphoesterase n=1 Tax=Pseudothermotoga lettingae (strain ATCC BAA-301 / DSM 14385 / NBRC 107922 / TMO) TaxID=416591 RepID=A8F4U3_PSELT|nr:MULTISPECIES: metallophosphoesterase family protein [Pseudothermotoga]ABV33177.1 phosphodiesterase, MJ0936 family [Pseudothermotoga lettingae TMO]KUK20291.1 MAG: Phosphodiesterase, family [Pseudothermotoga lettingae]MDI3494443.1 uncharacterized protein [Pseudothermotoga sp.]MDK2884182.1 uncharacterized protein [Pseudothermotoga sp.]GLI49906.1 phosphoesterase [Pseudothermotoga lettingae TMO]